MVSGRYKLVSEPKVLEKLNCDFKALLQKLKMAICEEVWGIAYRIGLHMYYAEILDANTLSVSILLLRLCSWNCDSSESQINYMMSENLNRLVVVWNDRKEKWLEVMNLCI